MSGLRLELPGGRAIATSLADVNDGMAGVGSRVWPIELRSAPADVPRLLVKPALTEVEAERVKEHFLLPRERLIEIIESAGRKPHVTGGGDMITFVTSHRYSYPQLYEGDL